MDSAIAAFRASLELDPEHAAVHGDLGMALRLAGDLAGALSAFERALDLDCGNSEIREAYDWLVKEKERIKRHGLGDSATREGHYNSDYSRFSGVNSDSD